MYGILMQNGEHITVLHNYLKSIVVYKMGYRMAATFLFHTNNTLKILIRGDLSSKDTLLNILKMEVKMAAL